MQNINSNRTRKSILGIDWGSKYIGLAYCQEGSEIIFPVGYLYNDEMTHFNISDIIERHKVKTIAIGRPTRQKDIQAKIERFMKGLSFIIDGKEIQVDLVDEDYTSVESGEVISNFKKNSATDTISAMLILERWKAKKTVEPQITQD